MSNSFGLVMWIGEVKNTVGDKFAHLLNSNGIELLKTMNQRRPEILGLPMNMAQRFYHALVRK